MFLIDHTYFSQELNIPNNQEEKTYGTTNENSFDSYIDRYTIDLLQKALGIALFNEFNSFIQNGVLNDSAPAKWKHLVHGAELTINDKKYYWQGLLVKNGLFKKSLLANYVYCKWLENDTTQVTGVGEVKGQAINTQNVNSSDRLIRIWNDFVVQYQGGDVHISQPTKTVYKGVLFEDYYFANQQDNNLSLLAFLQLSDEFEEVNPYVFELKNYLGI